MAEGLHKERGLKAQAGQFLDFLHGHRPGGVLGADGGDPSVRRPSPAKRRQAAGPADHLLGKGIALAGLWCRVVGCHKDSRFGNAQGLAGGGGEALADDQIEPAAGPVFVEKARRRGGEGDLFAGLGGQLKGVSDRG